MGRGCRQYEIVFESDKYNPHIYNRETDDYGDYIHEAGRASTLKIAKTIISHARKEFAADNPRNFKVYDSWADDGTGFAPVVFEAE